MGERKHTPGPWRATYFKSGGWTIEGGPNFERFICECGVDDDETGELESYANAHLLKAAPLMVEALEAVEWLGDPEYKRCCICRRYSNEGHAPDCLIGNALKAARGEQS